NCARGLVSWTLTIRYVSQVPSDSTPGTGSHFIETVTSPSLSSPKTYPPLKNRSASTGAPLTLTLREATLERSVPSEAGNGTMSKASPGIFGLQTNGSGTPAGGGIGDSIIGSSGGVPSKRTRQVVVPTSGAAW